MTLDELIEVLDAAVYRAPRHVTGFVCTPATYGVLKQVAREQPAPCYEPSFVWGTPVRVEDDPDPQPGEVLLELP